MKVIVRVTDNGEGIEKKYPETFERFIEWIKVRCKNRGGSGLRFIVNTL
jgi:two-component system phosphate regulon sensor histidine kinase PhoR